MQAPGSFENYLTSELGWLRELALQLVREAAAADDLVQEALVAALARRPELDQQLGARPWLARVLRNLASNARRSAQRQREREERAARAEALADTSELSAQADLQRALSEAVHALAEPYRSVILLRYFHGLEPAQIAARRNVPAATVRSQLSRAHEQLRGVLDRRHGGDSRAWCLALAPLMTERSALLKGASLSLTATLGLLIMKHWLLLSVVVLFATGLGLALRGGAPAQRVEVSSSAARVAQLEPPASRPSREDLAATQVDRATTPAPAPERAPSLSRRLSGRVLDAATRKPLAGYHVELPHEGNASEKLVTDHEGRFESALERQPGRFVALLSSDPGRQGGTRLNDSVAVWSNGVERELDWNGVDDLELAVTIRLTVELSFAPPVGMNYADFRAQLFDLDPDSAPVESVLFSKLARVRGDPPYVRFETLGLLSSTPQPRLLRIVSDDGLWRGQAWIDDARLEDPVRVELERCAAVAFELLGADARALSEPTLMIQRLPAGRILMRNGSDFDGPAHDRTTVDGLAPGAYRFVARAVGMQESTLELELHAGVELSHEFVLSPLPDAAMIRGELRSRSGRFTESVTIALPARADGTFRTAIVPWVERDGVWVAPFEFAGLRPGTHDLQFYLSGDSNRSWTPSGGEIEAPADNLVFVLDDVSPLQTLQFDVVDDASGAPLQAASVRAREGQRWLHELSRSPDAPRSYSISAGMLVNWSASCDGYEPAEGDNRSAVLVDGVWRQSVRLNPAR